MRSILVAAVAALLLVVSTPLAAQDIEAFAGGGVGDAGYDGRLIEPDGIDQVDGQLAIADRGDHRVRLLTSSLWTTVAGTGVAGFSGDGGPAALAQLDTPTDVAAHGGEYFVVDAGNRRIRHIDAYGVIRTVAGNGSDGFGGDGGPATDAPLGRVGGIAVDPAGNLYIALPDQHRVRRVGTDGRISTAAGTGVAGFGGDGGFPEYALLSSPEDVAIHGGRLHVVDTGNGLIRAVGVDDLFVTVAGQHVDGLTGDGVPALSAKLSTPIAIAIDPYGAMAVLESGIGRVRRIADGVITTLAGDGGSATGWYDLPRTATATSLGQATSIAFSPFSQTTIYIANADGVVLDMATDGMFVGALGRGVGDGSPVAQTVFESPTAMMSVRTGFLDADTLVFSGQRLRWLNRYGQTRTLAGDGRYVDVPGDGPARKTALGTITALAWAADGGTLMAEASSHRIRHVSQDHDWFNANAVVSTYAGNGIAGNSGDGGHCILASFNAPAGMARIGDAVVVSSGHRLRRIDGACIVSTIGGSAAGFSGDGGAATAARFDAPGALVGRSDGSVYVADRGNRRIRLIDAAGVVTTVAGNGSATVSGIGGPASDAGIGDVAAMVLDWQGRLVFTSRSAHRVLYIDDDGKLQHYAGDGVAGLAGDGGPAAQAQLFAPFGIALQADDSLLLADRGNHRLRKLAPLAPHGTTSPGAPPAPVATAGYGEADLVLSPPADDGGTPIVRYEIRSAPAGGVDAAGNKLALARLLTGLVNGQSYTFEVRAVNMAGPGPWSPPSAPVTPSADAVPALSISDVGFDEGPFNTYSQAQMTATLDRPSAKVVTFVPQLTHGTTDSWDNLSVSGAVTIPAGETSAVVYLNASGDDNFERDEQFTVRATEVVGAVPVRDGTGTLRNDDIPPPLALRDDLFVVRENTPTVLDFRSNDALNGHEIDPVKVRVAIPPTRGTVELQDQGTADEYDDRFLYTPPADAHGEDSFVYEFCYGSKYCRRARVVVYVRPADVLTVDGHYGGAFADTTVAAMRPLPSARFVATPLVAPRVGTRHQLTETMGSLIDDYDVWTGAPATSKGADLFELAPPADGQPRRVRLLARVDYAGHLYMGLDDNGDGQPSRAETRCVEANAPTRFCEIEVTQQPGQAIRYWTLVHVGDYGGWTWDTGVLVWEVPLIAGHGEAVATGVGRAMAGESFPVRVGWRNSVPHDRPLAGFVMVQSAPGVEAGVFPVEYLPDQYPSGAQVLVSGREVRHRARGAFAKMAFIDVPPDAVRLTLTSRDATGNVDFRLVRQGQWNNEWSGIDGAGTEIASVSTASGNETLTLNTPTLTEGRWYIVANTPDGSQVDYTLRISVEGVGVPVPAGSYFNPGRPGHGLFLYPAGGDWAGLWYTYLQDGTPTWYWLQGPKPGSTGTWHGTIYRGAWNGGSNSLTEVGEATVTFGTADVPAFRFSYVIDGETGSEPMFQLGAGCPSLNGSQVDISTHWYNPATAGTGYSIQMWEDYEFHAAFVYDALGVARYVSGEYGGFGGASTTMPMFQTEGPCPLCAFRPAVYRQIGEFGRTLQADGRIRMQLDGIYAAGVPGAWSVDELVQKLGGAGTTQACPQ